MNKVLRKLITISIAGITAFSSPLSIICEAPTSAEDNQEHVLKGEVKDHEEVSVELKNDHFEDNETIKIKELDQDGYSKAYKVLDGKYDITDGFVITIFDKDHKETEPEDKTSVRLNLPDDEIDKIKDTELYHIHKDEKEDKETAEKMDYEVKSEDQDDGSKQQYVSFETESFSSFVFVKQRPEETQNPENTPVPEETQKPESTQNAEETSQAKQNAVSDEEKTVTEEAPTETPYTVQSFSTDLFYGAEKQEDGSYVWNVNPSTDAYKKGHRFAFRINYAISGGNNGIPKNGLTFTVPKSILKDRNEASADTTEWSIPSQADVTAATKDDGTIDTDQIDAGTVFSWTEENGNYVIRNFRDIDSSNMNGYIELAYITSKSSFDYKDMESMNPFTCQMQVGDQQKDATQIVTKINTSAEITNVEITAPTERIENWDDKWGTAVKPADSDQYYYALWNVCSTVSATQPYTFTMDPDFTSNISGVKVLGYKFSGNTVFQAENRVDNQTNRDRRWDTVLVAIPKQAGDATSNWNSLLKVTNTVTPADTVDPATTINASKQWKWNKPVFVEPGGQFNTYKRGDGGYRTYPNNIWNMTTHHADSGSFHAGQYSRYDLEQFNGVGNTTPSLDTYNGFDFASWMVGYPGNATKGESKNSNEPWKDYWQKNVNYELRDENVFLIGNADALKSADGSKERTIDNGAVSDQIDGKETAIKLGNGDFRIDSIDFSTRMYDATFDSGTQEFKGSGVTYRDNDVLTFYGKFGDSDDWTEFATVNLKGRTKNTVDTVKAPGTEVSFVGDGKSTGATGTITLGKDTNLTAYKVTTSNAHYYTEIYTVPDYELLKSERVMNLLNGQNSFILLNNNYGKVTDSNNKQIHTSAHSDTDYAIKSQRDSSFKKSVVSTSNNTKKRYYTITWQLDERETVKAGDNDQATFLPQNGGVFYDLLPKGSTLDQNSVQVMDNYRVLPENSYEVYGISNYRNTGRTMLVVDIQAEASQYSVTFDTHHSWNSINDYGNDTYNPSAYETGNESITNGSDDKGGSLDEKDIMSDLHVHTGHGSAGTNKFLFAQNTWNIAALTSASNGLTKKVKAAGDSRYVTESQVAINEEYSYELRYMNAYTGKANKLVLFDSLENYQPDTDTSSDWHGILQSIDVSQIKDAGADPVVYISTQPGLNIADHKDLTDTNIWTKADSETDLTKATAVAIDLSKKSDNSSFVLKEGKSVRAVLYMKSPAEAPDSKTGRTYPYAYNNVYALANLFDANKQDGQNVDPQLIHQDYTKLSLVVAADLPVHKFNNETQAPVGGVTFRVYGTSDYGTEVDTKKTTGIDGNLTFERLEKGSYTLQEYDSTRDYFMDATEHKVVITPTGEVTVDGNSVTKDSPLQLGNNPRVHANVYLTKADEQNPEIRPQGAEYRLKGTSDYGNDMTKFATSDDNGQMIFEDVEKGAYDLTEVKAPSGYVKSNTVYKVSVDANGAVSVSKDGQDAGTTTSSVTGHYDFGYTGSVQTFTAPATGSYQLQVWGAGSEFINVPVTHGGYSIGTITLKAGQNLYIAVGGIGKKGNGRGQQTLIGSGGWNGGGDGGAGYQGYQSGTGGGGATSIQTSLIDDGQLKNYKDNTDSVVIVAGGGGGTCWESSSINTGHGGGLEGMTAVAANGRDSSKGGTQDSGFAFGQGQNGIQKSYGSTGAEGNGGGGGGWYGGYSAQIVGNSSNAGGGGGSGHLGSMLTDAQTIAGNQEFASPDGGTETGHSGSGFARITPMFMDSNVIYDEPLHSFSFVKKSTYDKKALGGAEFSLTGTSDLGTAINMSATSDSITGEVSFSGLEAGLYSLKETRAPEGFEADQNTYPVKINTTGAFTIDGLTSDDNGYVFYDRKLADKSVTVTKIWDDGEDHTNPSALDMTIQTNVPDAAQYSNLVWITNDDRLVLHVGKDVEITDITFTGDASKHTKTIHASDLVDASSVGSVVSDDKTAKYFLMDSVVDGRNEHFANIFGGFAPGENLTVKAGFSVDGTTGSRTMKCNSLFANGSSSTALIGYGRHLQNLNHDVSGLSPTVNKARQIKDISWDYYVDKNISAYGDFNHSDGRFIGISTNKTNDIVSYDGGHHQIQNLKIGTSIGTTAIGLFSYIGGSAFNVHDLTIVNPSVVKGTTPGNDSAVLAGTPNTSGDFNINNISIVYNDKFSDEYMLDMPTWSNTGLVVGQVGWDNWNGNLNISNVSISSEKPIKMKTTSTNEYANVGLLIGGFDWQHTNKTESLNVSDISVSAPSVDISTDNSCAGGLIGSVESINTSAKIQNVTFNISNGLSVASKSKYAGGLIGESKTPITIQNAEVNADEVNVSGINAGGIAGDINASTDIIDTSVTANDLEVSANTMGGGLIGCHNSSNAAGDYLVVKDSSVRGGNAGQIKASVAGGFIGYAGVYGNNSEISDCFSSVTAYADSSVNSYSVSGGFIGWLEGKINDQDNVVIKNCYSTGRTVNKKYESSGDYNVYNKSVNSEAFCTGGFIGYINNFNNSQSSVEIRDCFTTSSVNSADPDRTGDIKGTGAFIGVAHNSVLMTVKNCYSTGLITGKVPEFIGKDSTGRLIKENNYFLSDINDRAISGATGASAGQEGTPFATQSSPASAHPYDSTLGNTYPFDPKGFTEIYGDWPEVDNTSGKATGNAKKSNEINIYSLNASDTGETKKEVTVDDVLKDMKNGTVNDLPVTGSETDETGTNYQYTTAGKSWAQLSSNHWLIDDGKSPSIELTSAKNSEGNTVWTYTFAVEDNNRDYYVYEDMKDLTGYTSSGSDGRTALVDDPGIADRNTHSYTIINSKERTVNRGSLIISKHVSGNMPDPDQKFSFVITLSKPEGTDSTAMTDAVTGTKLFGSVLFNNGIAHITLGKDESVTIPELPEGIHYSVTEDSAGGYTSSATGQEGNISADVTSRATFLNTVIPVPENEKVSVKLQKKVEGIEPDGSVYSFHASFTGLTPNARYSYGKDTFASDKDGNAVVDVSLKKDEQVEFKDIPVGATYQFTEDGGIYTSSYEVKDANNMGSIVQAKATSVNQNEQLSTKAETADEGEAVTVTFTNSYEVAQTLTIQKKVKDWKDGKPVTSDEDKKFSFTVLFSNIPADADITSTVGRVTPDEDDGTATKDFFLTGDGTSVTFSGIPQGVRYQIIEGKSYRYNDDNDQEKTGDVDGNYIPSYEITSKDIYGKDIQKPDIEKKSNTFSSSDKPYSTETETVDTNQCDTVTFTNQRIHDLSIKENVTGNFGDKSHYFKFHAKLSGLEAGKTYRITGLSEKTTKNSSSGNVETNPQTIQANQNGNATVDFWMQDSETAVMNDVPAGTKYEITQEREGYALTFSGDPNELNDGMDQSKSVVVTNTLEGTVPTGLQLRRTGLILIVAGTFGIAYLILKRKNQKA